MIHLFAVLSLLAYVLAAVGYLSIVCLKREKIAAATGILLRTGFVFQTASIVSLFSSDHILLLETRGDYFFWISWLLPMSYFVLGRRLDYPIVGTFVASATLVFMASSSYLIHYNKEIDSPGNHLPLIILHAFPALLAELSLVLAFIVSCVFLIQSGRIKKRKSLAEQALKGPSLDSLEKLNHRFIMAGFIAMTVAVLSGSLWALLENRRLLGGDLYQWLAMAAWLVLAVILHSRLNLRWSAQKMSRVTVLATGVFIISFFLMILLNGSFLHGSYY